MIRVLVNGADGRLGSQVVKAVVAVKELERVGGSQPLQVNVRLVCATNADLPRMVS